MSKTTTKPLYKRLNEERTQGEWGISKDGCDIETTDSAKLGILAVYAISKEKDKANAQYTALAVNNLHKIAEALEKIKELSSEWDSNTHNQITEIAKEALNNIS